MTKNKNWDDESNEVKSQWAKFNIAGSDKVKGTLIAKRQIKSNLPGKTGELVWVYDLKVDEGTFHALDKKKKIIEEPIVAGEGEIWSVGGKPGIDAQMRNVKLGQKVGFKFLAEIEAKTAGYNPAKQIKVYTPKNDDGSYQMDEEWLAANTPAESGF